ARRRRAPTERAAEVRGCAPGRSPGGRAPGRAPRGRPGTRLGARPRRRPCLGPRRWPGCAAPRPQGRPLVDTRSPTRRGSCQPTRRHGVDAAILFSDIVLPLVVAGVDLEIKPGVGPVVASPVRSVADVDALPDLEPERLEFLQTAVRQLVAELGPTPLIGFAGAPVTLGTYLIEGGPSKEP